MYNRFIPGQSPPAAQSPEHSQRSPYLQPQPKPAETPSLAEDESGGLLGLLKGFGAGDLFKNLDRGDLLLMLLLFLICSEEGEELETLIILGLVFLFGL